MLHPHQALSSAAFFRSAQGSISGHATCTRLQRLRFRRHSSLSCASELDAAGVLSGSRYGIDSCGFVFGFTHIHLALASPRQSRSPHPPRFLGSQGWLPGAAPETMLEAIRSAVLMSRRDSHRPRSTPMVPQCASRCLCRRRGKPSIAHVHRSTP